METIQNESVVEINYTLTDETGVVLDSSEMSGPLSYIQGKRNIIPGLEKELQDKKVGDKIKVTVQPDDAYGHYNQDMVQTTTLNEFGEDAAKVQLGTQVELESDQGEIMVATVTKIEGQNVTLDANHPLAGAQLLFDVEVTSLREATAQELADGFLKDHSTCTKEGCC